MPQNLQLKPTYTYRSAQWRSCLVTRKGSFASRSANYTNKELWWLVQMDASKSPAGFFVGDEGKWMPRNHQPQSALPSVPQCKDKEHLS